MSRLPFPVNEDWASARGQIEELLRVLYEERIGGLKTSSTLVKSGDSLAAVSSGKTILSVSAKDEGAIGNGLTDDTVAIQNALNKISTSGGGTLYFPQGTYKITNSIKIPSDVSICGEGRYNTMIKGNLAWPLIMGTGYDSARNYRIKVSDLCINNTSKATSGGVGVSFRNVSESVMSNCYILNCETGLSLYTDAGLGCYYNDFYSLEFDTCTTGVLFASNENHLLFPRFLSCTTCIDWQNNSNSTVIAPCCESFTTAISISAGTVGGIILGGRYENTPTSGIGIDFAITMASAKVLILNPHFVGLTTNIDGATLLSDTQTVIYGG